MIITKLVEINKWIQLVLYLVPYLIIGYDILKKALKGIFKGQIFDENFLMAVATVGAVALGEFSEGAAVMLFYQIGELFQSVAVGKSRKNITSLMDIRPDYANVELNGKLEKIDPDFDFFILEFSTSSSILDTVESPNSLVVLILNTPVRLIQPLMISSPTSAERGTLSPVIALVLRVELPLIIMPSIGTFSPGFTTISIPLSFFAGIGCASANGVLVKGSNYLEALSDTQYVVFDKTGTLTKGVFESPVSKRFYLYRFS